MLRNLKITGEMIKIEHTLFALPFAFLGAFLAVNGIPSYEKIFWITVAMTGARSTAMAFNRLVDRKFDAENPRTTSRAIPSGLVSIRFVKVFIIVSSLIFFIASACLNKLTLILSPIAMGSILFYSYAKRFTSLSHLILGWCLSIAPTGAWIAVKGTLDSPIPLILSLIVILWTTGFDILYACQDFEYDSNQPSLHSIPKLLGPAKAFSVARVLHLLMIVSLVGFFYLVNLHLLSIIGIFIITLLLIYQHSIISPQNFSRMNTAFFTMNATVSVILFLTVVGDILLFRN